MKKPNRFIASILKTSTQKRAPMPWERGAARAAARAARKSITPRRKTA